MATSQRTPFIPAIWAANAQTSIPVPPVKGIGYRNPNLGAGAFTPGQLFGSIGDSATWNQYLHQVSAVTQSVEQYGIAPYCPSTQYHDRSLVLWTDGDLYQAIAEPSTGTPCTNKSYWEKYTPATVIPAPPITAISGVVLYVDYGKSVSGDGLTAATAFKNFTDCFTAMRTKFASANGVFSSTTWVPLFKIVATSPTYTTTVEEGAWRLQNINLEISFAKTFSMNTVPIYVSGSVVTFGGSGSFFPQSIVMDSSTVTFNCSCSVTNTTFTVNGGRGMSARNCNIFIAAGIAVSAQGTTGFDAVGMFMDMLGTLTIRSNLNTTIGQWVMCDAYVAGTLNIDSTNMSAQASATMALVSCSMRIAGTLTCRQPELIGGILSVPGGRLQLGSTSSTAPAFGVVIRGGFLYGVGMTVGSQTRQPLGKGAVTVGGSVESGLSQATWPGAAGWTIFGNGYYQS